MGVLDLDHMRSGMLQLWGLKIDNLHGLKILNIQVLTILYPTQFKGFASYLDAIR
jgi:hypothetical protein